MGLSEFLNKLPEAKTGSLSFAALVELSGISRQEANELAHLWEDWPSSQVLGLLERLASLSDDDPGLEFETVFRCGLFHPDPRCRTAAVFGLVESTDRGLAPILSEMLEHDPDAGVRAVTAQSMATLCALAADGKLHKQDGERMRMALFRVLENRAENNEVRRRALETISIFGGDSVNAYIKDSFASGDPLLRQSAVYAMGRSGDRSWLPVILNELDATSPAMRFEATTALGDLGDENHVSYLAVPLDDTDLDVQVAAVSALGRIGGAQAGAMLRKAVASEEPAVAEAAREALEILEIVSGLDEVIGPEMRRKGGVFGGRTEPLEPFDEEDTYNAPEREGWSNVHSHSARERFEAEEPDLEEK